MEDWPRVQRLFHREGLTKQAIARRLGTSRTTVIRLLALGGPPRYARPKAGSQLDPFRDEIAALLAADPTVAATVIRERLRRAGYAGGITILKEHLAAVRPEFLAARAFQRTSYLPGEIVQLDWWHTGVQIPVGKGQTRGAYGLVASLPPLGCPSGGVHARPHDGRLPGGPARLPREARRGGREGGLRQRRLDRRPTRARPGAAPSDRRFPYRFRPALRR